MIKLYSLILFAVILTSVAMASEPQVWTINTREAVLQGDAGSVSVDENGVITPAPKITEVFKTEQPYIWSAVADQAGNVFLGTGGEGRIFKVTASGQGALFCDLTELNVSALAIARDGSLFAATSPDGKVYKVDPSGKATPYFEPKEKYIWALDFLPDGSLAVATGDSGKLFRVKTANATPEASLWFDSEETHIISLAADASGTLYAGTDPGGLVLKFSGDAKPFAVLDSPLREVHRIALGRDGSIYALCLGESASAPNTPDPTPTPAGTKKAATAAKPSPTPAKKSKYDLSGAKSAVYRINSDGGSDVLWNSATAVGFSLYPHQTGKGVLVGTSDHGRIFSVRNDGLETLALQTEADQVSIILAQGSNLYAATSNQGRLLKIGPDLSADAVYESTVLDANAHTEWGNAWWTATGTIQIETRSGNSSEPNATWSAWEQVKGSAGSGKVASPPAQFLQWRAKLAGGGASLREMNVAFLTRNISPEVTSLQMLAPNVGLLANAPVQIDPNILLSGGDPQDFGIVIVPAAARRVYQRGARAFQWTAEDRNNDKLLYDLYIKDLSSGEYQLLRSNADDNFFTLDGLSFADGKYVFRVVVKDSASNPLNNFGTGEGVSEPFEIDNTQPVATVAGPPTVANGRAAFMFSATDKGSYLSRAEYSVDGGEWRTVRAEDGITDSPAERYIVEIPLAKGEHTVTLRVFDSVGNAGTASSSVKIP